MPLRASAATLTLASLNGSVFRKIPELALVSRILTGAVLLPSCPWTIASAIWWSCAKVERPVTPSLPATSILAPVVF